MSEGRNESGSPETQFSSVAVRHAPSVLVSGRSRAVTPRVVLPWVDGWGGPLGDGGGGHEDGERQ